MARRGNGEGTICQRKDGRWCAAVYVLTPDGGEKRVFVYGRTREEARDKLTELQERRRRNIPAVHRSLKLGDYLDYWLAQVVHPAVRRTTYNKYEVMVRLYLKPGNPAQIAQGAAPGCNADPWPCADLRDAGDLHRQR